MAASTAPDLAVFRMVGRNIRVATRASRCGSRFHVVRIVTVGAVVVRLRTRRTKYQHAFVAVLANHRLVFLEFVGAVAALALGVSLE